MQQVFCKERVKTSAKALTKKVFSGGELNLESIKRKYSIIPRNQLI